jgi:hypothetical protein
MTTQRQERLSGYSGGRIILHILCIKRDKRIKWHISGIIREIKDICLTILF